MCHHTVRVLKPGNVKRDLLLALEHATGLSLKMTEENSVFVFRPKEVPDWLEWDFSFEDCKDLIARHLAKFQLIYTTKPGEILIYT